MLITYGDLSLISLMHHDCMPNILGAPLVLTGINVFHYKMNLIYQIYPLFSSRYNWFTEKELFFYKFVDYVTYELYTKY